MTHSKRTHAGATVDAKTFATGKDSTSADVVVDDTSFQQLPVSGEVRGSPKKHGKKDEKHAASPRTPKRKDDTTIPHKHHKKDDDSKQETVVVPETNEEEAVVQDTEKDPVTRRARREEATAEETTEDVTAEDPVAEEARNDETTDEKGELLEVPSTYTAMTVDRAAIENSGDPAEPGAIANQVDGVPNVQAVAYDQQDGITKATNVTLPPGSLPDIVPGVPNVPLTSLLGTNTTQDLGAIPLPDITPGVPNVPAIVVTNPDAEPDKQDTRGTNVAATAQIQPSDVELKQMPRFAQQ